MPLPTVVVPITQIVIPADRIRLEPTEEIDVLARSIDELGRMFANIQGRGTGREGLLHLPIVRVNQDDQTFELVTGVRRFLACTEILHWDEMEVALLPAASDPLVYLRTQADENNMRRGFTNYERLLAAEQMLEIERQLAHDRQLAGKAVAPSVKGRATERAGISVNMSHATVEHGLAVLKLAAADPAGYGDLALAFQHNAPIDSTYHEMIRRQQYGDAPTPVYQPPADPRTNALLDRLDGVSSSIRRWLVERLQPDAEPIIHTGWMQDITVGDRAYTVQVIVAPKES